MEFPDLDPDAFAPKEKVADYFVAYARQIAAPIRCGVEVNLVRKNAGRLGFRVETSDGMIEANNVVAATGPFQRPIIPPVIPEDAGIHQSVTDRCNFRCVYCMPKEVFGADHPFLERREILSFEEITRVARIFQSLGIEKVPSHGRRTAHAQGHRAPDRDAIGAWVTSISRSPPTGRC